MQELAVHLDESLRQLDDLDREVFLLRDVEQMSIEEAAEVVAGTTNRLGTASKSARTCAKVRAGGSFIVSTLMW